MAGIGFQIRKLIREDNITSIFCGYFFSAIITTGPWIFTILALGGIAVFGEYLVSREQMSLFRSIIIYNYSFSLVLSGPVLMVITRYVSDKFYNKDIKDIPDVLLGSLCFLFLSQFPLVIIFYFYHLDLELEQAVAGTVNYFLISGIWLVSIFLSTLKKYRVISSIFAIGMLAGSIVAIFLGKYISHVGIIWGFDFGLGIILYSFIGRVLIETPYLKGANFGFLRYLIKFWDLALVGLFYNMAIWVDKWVMWFSHQGITHFSGLVTYPNYDTAMFIAYLTIIPSIAIFFVNIETDFFEKYLRYYKDIRLHSSYQRIRENQRSIIQNLLKNSRTLFISQALISLLAIYLAPKLFDLLNISYLLLGIFRIGVLGAFFQVFSLFLIILLFYFDFRKQVLKISVFMFLTNAGFTYVSLHADPIYYGYGYFLSSFATFAYTLFVVIYVMRTLPYQTFIKNNPSLLSI
jgi:uncharacterized membrane protein